MIVHDYFGGTIHRIRVEGGGTHYFNRIDGRYVDLTREQFDLYNIPLNYEPNETMPVQYCGKNPDTRKQYNLLKSKVEAIVGKAAERTENADAADMPQPSVTEKNGTPVCPVCGSPMILRTAMRGINAGKKFWGCSTYPKCRTTMNYEDKK